MKRIKFRTGELFLLVVSVSGCGYQEENFVIVVDVMRHFGGRDSYGCWI